jgi:hypothetical protein
MMRVEAREVEEKKGALCAPCDPSKWRSRSVGKASDARSPFNSCLRSNLTENPVQMRSRGEARRELSLARISRRAICEAAVYLKITFPDCSPAAFTFFGCRFQPTAVQFDKLRSLLAAYSPVSRAFNRRAVPLCSARESSSRSNDNRALQR